MTPMKNRFNKFKEAGSNRLVVVLDGRINYVYFTANVTSFCTAVPFLKEILDDTSLSPSLCSSPTSRKGHSMTRNKIQLRKHSAVEIKGRCFLHELCCACYNGWIKSVETWPKDLARFRRYLRAHDYTIDHADGNQLNNTLYNLSIMKKQINQSKQDITGEIKPPTVLYSGRYGKEYRIFVCFPNVKRKNGTHGVILKLRCNTASNYLDCLREIQSLGCGYGSPVDFPTSEDREAYGNRGCVTNGDANKTINSMIFQEKIAKMDKSEFRLCTGKKLGQMFFDEISK